MGKLTKAQARYLGDLTDGPRRAGNPPQKAMLRKLFKMGLASVDNPLAPRAIYSLTDAGRQALKETP